MGEFGVGSRGAGGDTISTAAPYYGMYNVLDENITFVEVCEALFAVRLPGRIHTMTDVTNGGGDDSSGLSRIARMDESHEFGNRRV